MRVRSLLAVLPLFATACTLLFPLDGLGTAQPSDAGADANAVDDASDAAPADAGDAAPADAAAGDASVDAAQGRYATEVLADGPVLYLRLGEKAGPDARDETQQRSPTYGGGVTFGAPGAIMNDPDTAVSFSGSPGSSLALPPGLDFPGKAPFTVEVWARRTANNPYGWAIDHQTYMNRNGWSLRFAMDSIAFERWSSSNDLSGTATPSPLQANTYQHVVATFDGAAMVLYVDNKLITSGTSNLSMNPMTTTWSLGAQNCACSVANFTGSLDEFAVYDKALSAARIDAHYHASGR